MELARSGKPPWVLALLFCGLLVALAFGPGLGGDFLNFDDDRTVLQNPAFQGSVAQGLRRILDPTEVIAEVYYPVTYLSLYLDYRLFGPENPLGFHLHSLALHALAGFVLILLLSDLGLSQSLAFLGAVPFLLHPALAESVVWVSSRKDPLSGLFVLLALLLGRRAVQRGSRSWPVLPLLLLACYSKGTAIVFPLLAFFLWRRSPRDPDEDRRFRRLWLASAVLALLALCHQGLLASRAGTTAFSGSLRAVPGSFLHYLRLAVWPGGLAVHYPRDELLASFAEGAWAKALALGTLLLGTLVLMRGGRRSMRLLGLGLALSLCSLLPFNNYLPSTALAAADRYLYLALPGVGLAMAGLAGAVPGRPRVWVSALLLLLLPALLLPISRARARVFTDSKRLWLANLEVWPDDVVAKVNLASWQMLRSRDGTAAARRLLREARSVATEPSHRLRIATMLFTCAHAEGDVSDALAQIETAVRVADELGGAPSLRAGGYRRTRVDLRLQWAETLEAAGRYEESEGVLDEILAVAPNQPDALGAKAQLLLSPLFARGTALPLGRGDAGLARARELLDRAIEAQGRRPSLPLGLARVDYHRLLGQRTEAMAVLNRLARHWRGHEKVHLKAASIYLDGAQIEGAIQELRTGLTYRESALLLEKLGQVQELSGRLASAEACFRRALALRPTSPRLRRQLARVLASSARRRVSLESPDKYASIVREALSLDPELPLLAYLEARLLGSRRDYDTALRRAREAADGLPDEPDVQQFRLSLLKQAGWWKLFQKKPEEAFRHFRELLDLAPRGFDVAAVIEAMRNEFNDRVAQASQAVVAEDWTAAESRFRAALELFPDHDGVVLQLGLVHYQLGRLVESIEGLRKAVRLAEKRGADPGRAVLYQVKVLREMKQREAARRLCELYLEGPKRDLLKDSVIRMRLQTQASALRDGG